MEQAEAAQEAALKEWNKRLLTPEEARRLIPLPEQEMEVTPVNPDDVIRVATIDVTLKFVLGGGSPSMAVKKGEADEDIAERFEAWGSKVRVEREGEGGSIR